MGYWKKHPRPDGQVTLEKLNALGWQIEDPPEHYTLKCPCGSHMTQLQLAPSDPKHFEERLGWARRLNCKHEKD
ncbi:hypothetical protein [Nocardiopsis valliformis]|uniref:hypothetical protein n=1 Tax=Nocardiopsis valliformis TaxID=239974 RepID=UPI00034563A9|nr:hypothetical protein [Nocardiopsis valliformis]